MNTTFTGSIHHITCNEQRFPEFPELLFGETESGAEYVDATSYLKENRRVERFLKDYEAPIIAIAQFYSIKDNEIVIKNADGHLLLHSSLMYLLVAFFQSDFMAYMMSCIHEMFTAGIVMSDTYLLRSAGSRIPPEVFLEYVNNAKKEG